MQEDVQYIEYWLQLSGVAMHCSTANLYQKVTDNNNNNYIKDNNNNVNDDNYDNDNNKDDNDNDDNDNNVTRQENYIGCSYQPLQCNAAEQENWDAIVKWRHWHHLQIGCIGSKFDHQVAPVAEVIFVTSSACVKLLSLG